MLSTVVSSLANTPSAARPNPVPVTLPSGASATLTAAALLPATQIITLPSDAPTYLAARLTLAGPSV